MTLFLIAAVVLMLSIAAAWAAMTWQKMNTTRNGRQNKLAQKRSMFSKVQSPPPTTAKAPQPTGFGRRPRNAGGR